MTLVLPLENFKHLYSLQPNASIANYDQDILIQHRTWTLQKSISTNPRFFFTAFPGLVVSTAAHNVSVDAPNSSPNFADLASSFLHSLWLTSS